MITRKAFLLSTLAFVAAPEAVLAGKPEFGKPLVVMVYDDNCHAWCGKVRPLMKDFKEQYPDIDFEELDGTQTVLKNTMKRAKELGVDKFIPDTLPNVPEVLFLNEQRQLKKELSGPKNKDDYVKQIELLLKK